MTTPSTLTHVQRTLFAAHPLAALAELAAFTRSVLRRPTKVIASQPRPGTAESAQLEAQNVRRIADAYAVSDRGFASDLYAAAERHERLHGVD